MAKPSKTRSPKTREREISDRTWKGQQSWNRERIVIIGDKRVRYTVKRDSYDFQSYGKAEVWNGEKWHTVHHIPGQELKNTVSYVGRDVLPTAFLEDMAELARVTRAVIS